MLAQIVNMSTTCSWQPLAVVANKVFECRLSGKEDDADDNLALR